MIATFGLNDLGLPVTDALSLMPTSLEWLPVENAYELMLIRQLVDTRRSFVKSMRYNLGANHSMINVLLTDVSAQPIRLQILKSDATRHEREDALQDNEGDLWSWHIGQEPPPLPHRWSGSATSCRAA
jgi:hypothetical protein